MNEIKKIVPLYLNRTIEKQAVMESEKPWKIREYCRICNSKNLVKYFDFGNMPLVDSFIGAGEEGDIRVPLEVMYCEECSLSQLSVVVNPKLLFSNYLYHSSVSNTFKQHCSLMARDLKHLFKSLNPGRKLTCIDIASNDGCLLKEFKKEGYQVLGVEPAANLCALAENDGIPSISHFWDMHSAHEAVNRMGKVDVITATNVFAHVDDLHQFLNAIHYTLSDQGVFVIEFPYMRHLIHNNEFDTIYHEHLSYFLVKPLLALFPQHHLRIVNLSEFEIHGGTIRVYVVKDSNNTIIPHNDTIQKYILMEEKERLHTLEPYINLEKNAQQIKMDLLKTLKEIKAARMSIAGFGASAKGNTFINYCHLDKDDIPFIVDDTKQKQGLLYAGTRIPIVPNEWLKKEKPDYVLILVWNFSREIMEKYKTYTDNGGKFMVAIPELRML